MAIKANDQKILKFLLLLYVTTSIKIVQDNLRYYDSNKDLNKVFNLKTCTIEELKDRCKLKELNINQTDLCILLFKSNKTENELASLLSIEVHSVNNKKVYYRRKLCN